MKKNESKGETRPRRRPITPETRENQLISMAMNLVEQRLADGTASSQETTHFLKLGSPKARLEIEKLTRENELLRAKTEALEAERDKGEMYERAIAAMKRYSGYGGTDDDEYEDY